MAQINFPTATSNGQEFEADNGVIYTYVGTPPNGFWSGSFQTDGLTTLDGRFLKLDGSNDPITNDIEIEKSASGEPAALTLTNYTGSASTIQSRRALVLSADYDNNSGDTSSYLSLKTDNVERLRIDYSGNVGIGTSAPDRLVHIFKGDAGTALSDGNTALMIENSSHAIIQMASPNTSSARILFGDPQDADAGKLLYDHSNDSLQFHANADERMRIDSSGNVAIGTNAYSGLGIANKGLAIYGTNGARLGLWGNGDRWWYMHGEDSNNFVIGARITNNTVDRDCLTITTGGNIGIGTSNPLSELQVEGTIRNNKVVSSATGDYTRVNAGAILRGKGGKALLLGVDYTNDIPYIQGGFADQDTGTKNIVLQPNGANVGIGTTNPGQKLDVTGTVRSSSGFIFGSTESYLYESAADSVSLRLGSNGPYAEFIDIGSNSMEFGNASGELAITAAGSEKIRIKGSGNVGIGASSPTELLTVGNTSSANNYIRINSSNNSEAGIKFYGDQTAAKGYTTGYEGDGNLFFIRSDSSGTVTDRFVINDSGNVGIGTSSPSANLEVSSNTGSASITPTDIRISTTTNAGDWSITDPWGRLAFYSGDGSNNGAKIQGAIGCTAVENFGGLGRIGIFTHNGTNLSEHLSVSHSGNVGIGNTSPNANLEIENNGLTSLRLTRTNTQSNYAQISASGANSELLTIEANPTNEAGGNLLFKNGGAEAARIDPGRRLLVGHTQYISAGDSFSPQNLVYVENAGSSGYQCLVGITNRNDNTGPLIVLGKTRGTSKGSNTIVQNNDILGQLRFVGADGNDRQSIAAEIRVAVDGTPGSNDMPGRLIFRTTADGGSTTLERMRIAANGDIKMAMGNFSNTGLVGQNATGGDGVYIDEDGGVKLQVSRWQGGVVGVNRMGNDGPVITVYGQGNFEGSIDVNGSTVSLTGGHLSRWSQLENNAERIEILRGSVLSNLDEMCEWGEEDNEQLNRMKVSDVEGDPNVAGVFQGWDDDDETYLNDFHCAMTGDFIIRIAQGTTVARGDLLMSAGDGTAKPQGDDIVRSKTIAKVTSTVVSTTYDDGSYCVPCVLMAC